MSRAGCPAFRLEIRLAVLVRLLAVATLAVTLAACSTSSSAAPPGSPEAVGASSAASTEAAAASLATPAPAASAPAAETTAPSAPPAAATPAAAATAVAGAAPAHKYDCKKLISDAEMRKATGLSTAEFFHQELWTDTPGLPVGEVYCQFFAGQGATSIALTIATGAAFDLFEAAAGGGAGLEELPGIGEHALFSAAAHLGAARAHGVLVLVKLTDMSGNGLESLDLRAAVSGVLKVVIDRV